MILLVLYDNYYMVFILFFCFILFFPSSHIKKVFSLIAKIGYFISERCLFTASTFQSKLVVLKSPYKEKLASLA